MLAILRGFASTKERPLDSINVGVVFVNVARLRGTYEAKLEVIAEANQDLGVAIMTNFLHPVTKSVNTQGLANVAWGMIKMGLGSQEECNKVLWLLSKNLDRCSPADLSIALNCFVEVKQTLQFELQPGRLAQIVREKYEHGDGHSLTRYLYNFEQLGINDQYLSLQISKRLATIADDPQQCSNTVLALSRLGISQAENVVLLLVSRMMQLKVAPRPQAISNTFLACFEQSWTIDKDTALEMLQLYLEAAQDDDLYGIIQVLGGLERHGITAQDIIVTPLVERLILKCPRKFRHMLGRVVTSLYRVGYHNANHLSQLEKLAL